MILTTKEIYPAYKIEDNCMLGKGGDITFAFRFTLPEIYSLGERDYDNVHSDLFKFVKMLSDCIVHKQDIFLKRNYLCENLPNSTFLQQATYKRFYNREHLQHFSFLFITLPQLKSLSKSYITNSVFKSGKAFQIDRSRILNFAKEVERAVSVLNASRFFHLDPLHDFELREVIFNYLNGFTSDKLTDVIFQPEFQIGDNFYNVYAVNNIHNQPESISNCVTDIRMSSDDYTFFKGFLQPLGLDLECNHIVNQIIFIDDHKELRDQLRKTHKQFHTFSKFSPENETGAEHLANYLKDIDNDEKIRLARAHVNLIVWADSKESLRALDSTIISKFKEVDITPYYSKYIDYVYYYLCSIPGNSGNFPRQETFDTDLLKAINYFITVTNYISDDTGIVLNDRRFNIPILKDDFYKPYETKLITSRNTIVAAPTGGGKSFLLNHILRQSVEQDFLVTLIDLGGSYEKVFHLYPDISAYIQYKEGEPLGINPFLVRSGEELTADKIRTLADFNFILWKKDKKEEDDERVSMYKILQEYYRSKPGNLSFPNFHAFVKETKDLLEKLEIEKRFFDRDEFIHNTSEYAEGMFKFLLEDTKQSYYLQNKQLVGFELENIKDNLDILPIMFMMIRDVTENVIWGNKSLDKRIWFEEAAKLLKYPIMLRIMDYYFQTIRKHNGSVGIVLQTIDQIPNNEIGNAIINNTHIFYILEQDKNVESLKNRLNLSSHDVNQILSIQNNFTGDRKYTEFLLKMGNYSNVYRLEVPREGYYAFLSEGKDKKRIMDEFEKTGSMEKAIMNLIKTE